MNQLDLRPRQSDILADDNASDESWRWGTVEGSACPQCSHAYEIRERPSVTVFFPDPAESCRLTGETRGKVGAGLVSHHLAAIESDFHSILNVMTPSTPNPRDTQYADDFTSTLTSALEKVTVNVFLCGKGLASNPSETFGNGESDLRLFLQDKLQNEITNCRVKLGEHRSLIERYRDAAGDVAFNLADHEFVVARTIDLVVIFPCSPGSFAELGMFSREESIAAKMAIFLDTKYSDSKGYIVEGPVAAAKIRKSSVYTMDYSDRNAILREIVRLVMIRRALKGQQKLLTT